MIESLVIKNDDYVIPAFVFGMAGAAVFISDLWSAAVETLLVCYILPNIFMIVTLEAQVVLLGLAEKFVTLVTIGFIFRMWLGKFAGHQRALHRIEHTGARTLPGTMR